MYYIGVDGGGTKTQFVLYDELGVSLACCQKESCHYAQVGYDGLKEILKSGINELCKSYHEKIKVEEIIVGLGLAGYGREKMVREKIEQAVGKALKDYHAWYLTSDFEIAYEAALNHQDGILVVAGTGSVCMAKHNGEIFRTGGWGPAIGDEGSGYWIGRKVLEVFSKQADGRMEKTPLYDLVKKTLDLKEDAHLVSYALLNDKQHREKVAQLSKVCVEALKFDDCHAKTIIEKAAKELATMVNTLHKKLGGGKMAESYAGGIFQSGEFMVRSFISYLDDEIMLIKPINPNVFGGYLFAKNNQSLKSE